MSQVLVLFIGALFWLVPARALAASRQALVIGSNQGLGSEPVLAFAEQDAEGMARIFKEVGGMPADRVQLLTGRRLGEPQDGFERPGSRTVRRSLGFPLRAR